MDRDNATVTSSCPSCDNEVTIDKVWTPGGVNDYGGYVLECSACKTIFELYLGRDISDSRVMSGARVLDTYDKELGNREDILKAHKLST